MLERRFIQKLVHDVGVVYEAFQFSLTCAIFYRIWAQMECCEDATMFFDEVWPKDL